MDDIDSERPTRRDRSGSSIRLIYVLTATLIITGICWRIHVSQIRQSMETCHRNYHELNSTLQSKLFAHNSNLSDLKQMHSDLRHHFCELLTSRREQTCCKDWITNKDRCYFVSTFETSFRRAMQECSNRDSRLLEINSRDEASFVSHNLLDSKPVYWIGKCENGNVHRSLLFKASSGTRVCRQCGSSNTCDGDWRFICERSAPVFPDIPEKIQRLCQQPVAST
ncbi:oxidized low-density lipoprotein receptor 1-like [Hypanus sabinus]|uniref:oxidized low-density lipoprotein receptor 1-like n=1 Tax=Hypanus sabinus TaxID=79690 RepID=UPI0028C467E2|nr:oxidized low-density lipoprotein receptor 1-like [Hypanus sabinus]XP_059819062.1 oxidized low-density lipoprotein receptor 1-like [Hypanus sabinus]